MLSTSAFSAEPSILSFMIADLRVSFSLSFCLSLVCLSRVLKLKVYMRSKDLWVGSSEEALCEIWGLPPDSTVRLRDLLIDTDLRSFS
jgi:hypothetical protein